MHGAPGALYPAHLQIWTASQPRHIAPSISLCTLGAGKRHVINDNNGKLFQFVKETNPRWGGYVAGTGKHGTALEPEVALGASHFSDLFFLGAAHNAAAPGLRLTFPSHALSSQPTEGLHGLRACWYSLAAVLRQAAAPLLDIKARRAGGRHLRRVCGERPPLRLRVRLPHRHP